MWKIDDSNESSMGLATWTDADSNELQWHFDVRGGHHGISLRAANCSEPCIQIVPVDDQTISDATEQFVRGRQLHVSFPQQSNRFGVRIVIEPIQCEEEFVVFEFTISIQTSLLDLHPMLDIVSKGKTTQNEKPSNGSPGVSIIESSNLTTAILLGQHDSPFTTDHSSETEVSLRLFGDFLEKGVIRKARPWFVVSTKPRDEISLVKLLENLNDSPLPLTP